MRNNNGILELNSYFSDGCITGYSHLSYYQCIFILNKEYLRNFLNGLVLRK